MKLIESCFINGVETQRSRQGGRQAVAEDPAGVGEHRRRVRGQGHRLREDLRRGHPEGVRPALPAGRGLLQEPVQGAVHRRPDARGGHPRVDPGTERFRSGRDRERGQEDVTGETMMMIMSLFV